MRQVKPDGGERDGVGGRLMPGVATEEGSAREGGEISADRKQAVILLVDDDHHLLVALRRGLTLRGFDVELASDSIEAMRQLRSCSPDVMVLDVMMPGMDGLSLCRLVRDTSDIPILMLTARDGVYDRVAGLEAGADDYLVKPFALDELIARIQALLRRARAAEPQRVEQLTFGDLSLDRRQWVASRGEEKLALTATEFRMLEHFMRHSCEVVTREAVIEALWGPDYAGESNVVDVHVANLRQKLEGGGNPRLIQTVRGVGYSMREGE